MLIGLTGGIGSGKTTVSDTFARLGVPIVDTDIVARDVLTSQPQLIEELSTTFGSSIINQHGQLDRTALREIAFSSSNNKEKLDQIMHPAIRRQTLSEIALQKNQTNSTGYCIAVVPLLIETNFKELVDRILVITAPHERKLAWLKQRSGLDKSQAEAIIRTQTSDAERIRYAHEHIINDSDVDGLVSRVKQLHQKYCQLAIASNSKSNNASTT